MAYKLDLKDKKLLYELDLNSRQSFNEIARKIKLSKNAVAYRINNLQKEGIIKQFHTVIDTGKLGYISFRLYLKLQNASPKKEQEIIDFLKKKEIVTWVVSIEEDYTLGALILTKSVKEMNNLWIELLDKYNNYIEKRLLTIMSRVSYFSRAYLLDLRRNEYETVFATEPQQEQVMTDETDLKILRTIAPNARIPIIELASKLRLTSKTIITRLKSLEERKIIMGYKTVFDIEKIGYQYFKIYFKVHNTTKERKNEFREYIKAHPNIIYDDYVLGGEDFEIEVQVKDIADLRKIIEDIKANFTEMIQDYRTMLFYKEHKYLFFPVK